MTREDINDIINAICSNDEDYEKPCISPKYLRQELEQLALDQRQWNQEPTTKNDLGVDCIDRAKAQTAIEMNAFRYTLAKERGGMGQVEWSDQLIKVSDAVDIIRNLPPLTPQPCEDAISRLDENAKETVSHLIECYEDGCFTKDERVTLAGIAFQARLRFQLNKYTEREDGANEKNK